MNINNYSNKIKQIEQAKSAYVAFLDLLGFGRLVLDKNHDEIRALYQGIIRTNLDLTLTEVTEQAKKDSKWIELVNKSCDYSDIEPQLTDVKLTSIAISDSIFLSTQDDSFKSLMLLIAGVRNLMARLLQFGFPLRGAIAHGVITSDCQIEETNKRIIYHQILGRPIVHATELEKAQNWSGCALHSSVIKSTGAKIIGLIPTFITLHETPIKQIDAENQLMLVVNWPNGMSDGDKEVMNENRIREAFSAHGKKINKTVEEKIINTIRFHERTNHRSTFEELEKYCIKHIPDDFAITLQKFAR